MNTENTFDFLGFSVNPEQRSITKNLQPVNLSKKSFDMLVVLLNKQGELITKEELLIAVWPNQIVTDSAINKHVTRLRKLIDPIGTTESCIETIRGVGIRFNAQIQFVNTRRDITSSNNTYYKYIVLIIFIGIILQYFIQNNIDDSKSTVDENIIAISINESIKIAIIPAIKSENWIDVGGLNYLSDLLQKHTEIDTISPQHNWFKHDNISVLALQLSKAMNINYALTVQNTMFNNQYTTKMTLRNKHGVLANGELHATSLPVLFKKIDNWVILQLNITSGVILSQGIEDSHISEFVLESYLRGLSSTKLGKFSEAADFLTTVVNQKQFFFPAWLLLTEVEAELGYYKKSLARISNIEQHDSFNSHYLNDLYNVKAKTLIFLNRLDEAQLEIEKSLILSIAKNDMKAIIVSLSSKAMIQDKTKVSKQLLATLSEQLNLIEVYNPVPSKIAKLNYKLAIINQRLFNYDNAKRHINIAIDQYKDLNVTTELVSSYRVKANIFNDLGETGHSLLVLQKAGKMLEKIDSANTLAEYFACKARNLYEEGYLTLANIEIKKLHDLSIKYDNLEAKLMALIIQAELQISYVDFSEARHTVNHLISIVMANPEEHPIFAQYVAALDMFVSARSDNATFSRKKMNDYLSSYPILRETIGQHLRRIEAHIFAAQGYKNKAITMLQKLLEYHINNQHYLDASYIGYEILNYQWGNNMPGYLITLNRVQEFIKIDYPILKYRAKYFAYKKDFINALINMQELKLKAREFWSEEDQLLMEHYQKEI